MKNSYNFFSFLEKFNDKFEFLNKIINNRQKENSKPAKPKRKKDSENKFKSSFHKPLLIVMT